uniref:Uncharacterized protein n=1 Tax=Zea mays TaxID=4577 RepID=C4J2I2_MAIZE|nr:unknown [Zea mays]
MELPQRRRRPPPRLPLRRRGRCTSSCAPPILGPSRCTRGVTILSAPCLIISAPAGMAAICGCSTRGGSSRRRPPSPSSISRRIPHFTFWRASGPPSILTRGNSRRTSPAPPPPPPPPRSPSRPGSPPPRSPSTNSSGSSSSAPTAPTWGFAPIAPLLTKIGLRPTTPLSTWTSSSRRAPP